MKKLFIVPALLLTLTACSSTTPANFDALSQAAIKAEVQKQTETLEALGYTPSEVSGRMSFDLEGLFTPDFEEVNGSFSTDYKMFSHPKGSQFSLMSPIAKFSAKPQNSMNDAPSDTVSAEVSLKEFSVISSILSYLQASDVKLAINSSHPQASMASMMVTPYLESFNQKLGGKWIEMTPPSSAYGLPNDEVMAMKNLATKFIALTQEDITKFLTENMLLKSEGEAKVDGTKYTYNVSAHVDNIVALRDKIGQVLHAEEALTTEEKEKLARMFTEEVKVSGTVTFDTKNPLFAEYKVQVQNIKDNEVIVNIDVLRDGNALTASVKILDDKKETVVIALQLNTDGKKVEGNVSATIQDEREEGSLKVAFVVHDKVGQSLTVAFKTPDIKEASLNYVKDDILAVKFEPNNEYQPSFSLSNKTTGNDFMGEIMLDSKKVATWSGKISNNTLDMLDAKFTNADEGEDEVTATLKLAKNGGDMAKGKLEVREGEKVGTADISIQAEKEKFGLIMENVVLPESAGVANPFKKLSFFISGKLDYVKRELQIPTDVISLEKAQELLQTQQ